MYKERCNPYNLLATMIAMLLEQSESTQGLCPSASYDEKLHDQAQEALQAYSEELKVAASIGLNSQTVDDILKVCKEDKDCDQLRWMIRILDSRLSWNGFADHQGTEKFESMNSNVDETGILLIPNVDRIRTEHDGHLSKTALCWYSSLNSELKNCRFIKKEALKDSQGSYSLENVIYQPEINPNGKDHLIIVFSPMGKENMEEILNIELKNGDKHNFFNVNGLKSTEKYFQRYCSLYKTACAQQADIVMAPEMLCDPRLFDLDEDGFNNQLNKLAQEEINAPSLILLPTLWSNGRNCLRVYDQDAKILLTQDKQHPFIYESRPGREKFNENLYNRRKCIEILHIPGWGRIGFPICIDYLIPEYRDILVRQLGVNLMLCPSYSMGARNFELSTGAGIEFDATTVWINSCSALQPYWEQKKSIGAVRIPNIGMQSCAKEIKPGCTGEECDKCAFLIDIPLNCAGPSRDQDLGVQVKRISYELPL